MMAYLAVAHPMFPSNMHNASEPPAVENRKSPGILNTDRPGLAVVKKNATNRGILHPSLEGKPDLMAAPKSVLVSRKRLWLSQFFMRPPPNTSIGCD